MSERFAFKIDKALKLNLYKICRLCGIDNPDKVPILSEDKSVVVNIDGEPELWKKVQDLIGFKVEKDDKMPQTMCTLCVEKINDFYEFREMCYATNAQTRKLLGLKNESPKRCMLDVKTELVVKEEVNVVGKRGRKRKSDETNTSRIDVKYVDSTSTAVANSAAMRKKMRLAASLIKKDAKLKLMPKEEIKDEPFEALPTNSTEVSKLKQVCGICTQRFSTKGKLERHKAAQHVPHVPRFICTACDETLRKGTDIKNHQLWHKLSKTPYACPFCSESLLTIYAYSRHMRDHCYEAPATLLVLDRVCPQCRESFVTNFLYNTHTCAVRTRKCAGCNRQMRNDAEYLRHAASCAKAYLNYSKHIPAAEVAESCVRIKNENEVEAAEAAETIARIVGIPLDMTPVVSLTRLPSPVVMAANQCVVIPAQSLSGTVSNELATTSGKVGRRGSKKGVSRKDLKRVDELLKSTLDALVSIKHEPEVHVEPEAPTVGETECPHEDEEHELEGSDGVLDAFHHADNDDDEDEDENSESVHNVAGAAEQLDGGSLGSPTSHVVKQEVVDDSYNDQYNSVGKITVKTEIINTEGGEDAAVCVGKMPVLKIKIKKEHGTLNSSLVDEVSARSEKKKKKKKRKEAERNKERFDNNQNSQESVNSTSTTSTNAAPAALAVPQPGIVQIKRELLDDDTADPAGACGTHTSQTDDLSLQPEATVMTSIPLMQFQIACISSGVDFAEETAEQDAPHSQTSGMEMQEIEQDVKPNRDELDRILQISNVSSGIDMGVMETESLVDEDEEVEQTNNPGQSQIYADISRTHAKRSPAKKLKRSTTELNICAARSSTGKALKSTGGMARTARKSTNDLPQIVAVHGGSEVDSFNAIPSSLALGAVHIKAEPRDRGYADELPAENVPQLNDFPIRDLDEQQYIDSIDYSNVKIKQEPDIEVSEVQLSHNEILASTTTNGIANTQEINTEDGVEVRRESRGSTIIDSGSEEQEPEFEADGESLSDTEEEVEEDEEEREYREIEMPPLLLSLDDEEKQKEGDYVQIKDLAGEDGTNHENVTRSDEAAHSGNTASFLITNVCSQATEMSSPTEVHHPPPTNSAEEHSQSEQSEIASDSKVADISDNCSGLFIGIAAGKSPKETETEEDNTNVISINKECSAVEPAFSISGTIDEPKEVCLEAQPFCESREQAAQVIATNDALEIAASDAIDEEHQNVMNQEVLEHDTAAADDVLTTIDLQQLHPYLEDITSSSESGFSGSSAVAPTASTSFAAAAATKVNMEETDNLINEHTDAALRQLQQSMRPSANSLGGGNGLVINSLLLDDRNINEIAENNNNANIERELQDDNADTTSVELRLDQLNDI